VLRGFEGLSISPSFYEGELDVSSEYLLLVFPFPHIDNSSLCGSATFSFLQPGEVGGLFLFERLFPQASS